MTCNLRFWGSKTCPGPLRFATRSLNNSKLVFFLIIVLLLLKVADTLKICSTTTPLSWVTVDFSERKYVSRSYLYFFVKKVITINSCLIFLCYTSRDVPKEVRPKQITLLLGLHVLQSCFDFLFPEKHLEFACWWDRMKERIGHTESSLMNFGWKFSWDLFPLQTEPLVFEKSDLMCCLK